MNFPNRVRISPQSVREKRPIVITWEKVSENVNNSVVVSRRKDMAKLRRDGVDLSPVTTMQGNRVMLEHIFTPAEDASEGSYIITVVIRDAEFPVARLEINIIVDVVAQILENSA